MVPFSDSVADIAVEVGLADPEPQTPDCPPTPEPPRTRPKDAEQKRLKTRKRVREHAQRKREARRRSRIDGEPDVLCYTLVPLLKSELARIVADLQMTPSDDVYLSRAELRKIDGLAIAAAARSVLRRRNNC
jgi:hypothetical protein